MRHARGSRSEPPLPPLHPLRPEHVAFVLRRFQRLPPDVRDDLTQETLVRAMRLPLGDSPAGLLVTTARLVMLAHWKAERRRREVHEAVPIEDTMATVEHPEALHAAAGRDLVRAAVADLPEPLRSTFVRIMLHKETATQVAADLGIARETVTARLHKARRVFLSALREHMFRRGVKPADL